MLINIQESLRDLTTPWSCAECGLRNLSSRIVLLSLCFLICKKEIKKKKAYFMDSLGRLNESTHLKYLAYSRESMKSSFVEMKIRGKGKTWEEDHGRMALKPNMETNLYNPLGYKWNLPHLWMLWVHAVELTPEFCYFLSQFTVFLTAVS